MCIYTNIDHAKNNLFLFYIALYYIISENKRYFLVYIFFCKSKQIFFNYFIINWGLYEMKINKYIIK